MSRRPEYRPSTLLSYSNVPGLISTQVPRQIPMSQRPITLVQHISNIYIDAIKSPISQAPHPTEVLQAQTQTKLQYQKLLIPLKPLAQIHLPLISNQFKLLNFFTIKIIFPNKMRPILERLNPFLQIKPMLKLFTNNGFSILFLWQ